MKKGDYVVFLYTYQKFSKNEIVRIVDVKEHDILYFAVEEIHSPVGSRMWYPENLVRRASPFEIIKHRIRLI